MFQIVCIEHGSDSAVTMATGFRHQSEARRAASDWIDRQFLDVAYDHSLECRWFLDDGRTYRIAVELALNPQRRKDPQPHFHTKTEPLD
jgi:hypothetical protein